MEKSSKKGVELLNVIVSEPFYLFHFLLFFSYLVIRISTCHHLFSPDFAHHLLRREIQSILAFLVLVAVKLVKEESWESFVADTLFVAKGFLLLVAFILDYHLAICYGIGFLVIFILSQQPPYNGLGNSTKLTPLQLEVLLTEGNTSRFWLVEFRSLLSSTCVRTSQFFPDLSVTYSNKNLSFGIVDLGLFPNVADKFGISLGVSMNQLPTYILFDKGTEVTRYPDFDFEGKVSHQPITKKLLCHHFELDRHLIEYIHIKSADTHKRGPL